MIRISLFTFSLLIFLNSSYASGTDTIKVYFDLDVPEMNTTARHHLDSLAYNDILLPDSKYGIIGYADYLGDEEYNIELSEKRAYSVQEYLQGLGVKKDKIETVIGKGEVSREQEQVNGYPQDRRVDIIIGGFKVPPPVVTKVASSPKIDIERAKKNETIRLDRIYFLPGSHFIREESREELVQLYLIMKNTPSLKIRIEGHICCNSQKTPDGYDYDSQEYKLSENRAKFVYDYLIERGIDKNRLSYIGFSIKKPLIWPERTPQDENLNRRVEIRIIDK